MARLVVVCGLPGAGKTTLARGLEASIPALRLNADEWLAALGVDVFDEAARARVEALQWEVARRALSLGANAVVEWGSWSRAERDALREGARALGAEVELRYLDVPLGVLWERVRTRGAEQRHGSRALTYQDLEGYAAMLEPPEAAELARYDTPVAP